MTHFCGWKAEAGLNGISGNLSELVSDSRNVTVFDSPMNGASDDLEGADCTGFIFYNGQYAPCSKCEEQPKSKVSFSVTSTHVIATAKLSKSNDRPLLHVASFQWCAACKSLARNKSTADCRRNKKEEALLRENLQSQLEGTQSLVCFLLLVAALFF